MRINEIYWKLRNKKQRYMVIYGGRRSGKSIGVSQLLITKAFESGKRIGVIRKVATTIRLSVWERILSELAMEPKLDGLYKVNKADRTIELANGSEFVFFGMDDPHKIKSIEGLTDYWIEEANELTEEDFDTLDVGLSPESGNPQIWLTFNPLPVTPGYKHWLQERFIDKVVDIPGTNPPIGKIRIKDNILVLRTWYKHNVFCPKETIKLLESYKKTNPQLWRMWGLGEFTKLEGVILDNWDVVDNVPDGVEFVGYGLDFGFADDPAALVKVWKHNNDVWLEEKIYAKGLTNQELSATMEYEGVQKEGEIVADSAEPKSIEELRRLGWYVLPAEKGADYKRAAAQYLRGLNIHVLSNSPNLKKELSMWCWKTDKRSQRRLPIPEDGNDHLIDATIYRLFRGKARWRVV